MTAKRKIFFYLITALYLALAAPSARADVIDKIVAVVNNEIITQREVDSILLPVYEQYRTIYSGQDLIKRLEEARQEVMEKLIEDKLILSEAKKAKVEISDAEIESKVKDMRKRFTTHKELERALLEQNMTLKELRARYREQMMSRKFIMQQVGATITVTPVEIHEYYETHPEEFTIPEQIKMRNILIIPRPDFPAERAAVAAGDILKSLQDGNDFGQIARAVSKGPGAAEGGITDYVTRGELMPEIEKVVFAKNIGELTDVIQTSAGYHIFKIEDKKEKRHMELSEARRPIDDMLFNRKITTELRSLVAELKKRAYIAFK